MKPNLRERIRRWWHDLCPACGADALSYDHDPTKHEMLRTCGACGRSWWTNTLPEFR